MSKETKKESTLLAEIREYLIKKLSIEAPLRDLARQELIAELEKKVQKEMHDLIHEQDRALFNSLGGKAQELQHEIEKREYALEILKEAETK